MTGWLTRHQAPACLGAVVLGVVLGLGVPGAAEAAALLVTPALIVLLLTTFAAIPLERLLSFDARFAVAVLGLNFLLVPLVVAGTVRLIPLPDSVVVAVLVVLLTPCIDYVIVFTERAGGASARLLALTPALMIAQIVLLPVWLRLILGEDAAVPITPGPFLTAVGLYLVVPLLAAFALRRLAPRFSGAARTLAASDGAMVPVMLLTLVLIAAAEVPVVMPHRSELSMAVVVFVVFALVMTAIGWVAGRCLRVDVPERRALIFTGVTRNSLVMLPIVRALDGTGVGSATVVAQTLTELLVLTGLVWLVPRIVAPAPERQSE